MIGRANPNDGYPAEYVGKNGNRQHADADDPNAVKAKAVNSTKFRFMMGPPAVSVEQVTLVFPED